MGPGGIRGTLMGSRHGLRKVGVTLPVRSVGEKIPYSASPHGRREPVTENKANQVGVEKREGGGECGFLLHH